MKRVICNEVEHDVKVTRVAPGVWGIRVFVNGEINQESTVDDRTLIGAEISEYASDGRQMWKYFWAGI